MNKVVIRIRELDSKKIIKNRKTFTDYNQAIEYIESNLNNKDYYISLVYIPKIFVNSVDVIFYDDDLGYWKNLERKKEFLKTWLNK